MSLELSLHQNQNIWSWQLDRSTVVTDKITNSFSTFPEHSDSSHLLQLEGWLHSGITTGHHVDLQVFTDGMIAERVIMTTSSSGNERNKNSLLYRNDRRTSPKTRKLNRRKKNVFLTELWFQQK